MKKLHIVFALLLSVTSGFVMCGEYSHIEKAAKKSVGYAELIRECQKCSQKDAIADECRYINQRLERLDTQFISGTPELKINNSDIKISFQWNYYRNDVQMDTIRLFGAVRTILRDKSDKIQAGVYWSCQLLEDRRQAKLIEEYIRYGKNTKNYGAE